MTEPPFKAEYSLTEIIEQRRDAADRAFAEGQSHGRDEAFDLVSSELEKVLNLSIFYDKPGLGTALAVVKNTRSFLNLNNATHD